MASRPHMLDFVWPAPPTNGEVIEVSPGLLWARLPLPFRLNHVNVWLLEEDDGWTVIDTGCATPELFAIWDTLLAGPMRGLPVRRVIATHGHVDHIGLSGWLVERFGAEFIGTFGEWMWARVSHMPDVPGADSAYHAYLRRHGVEDDFAAEMVARRQNYIDLSTPIPSTITEIRDGQMITFGRRDWQVIVTRGHTFEHSAFYNEQTGILIAGDHLLPTISPVIAVYEMVPNADPLGDYLKSFSQFDAIPDATLVLPSHGLPYRGIHQRIDALREHHRERLEATAAFLSVPRTAIALSRLMFPRVEGPDNTGFALGETLAHVNCLLQRGEVEETTDAEGRSRFQASQTLYNKDRKGVA